MHIVRSQVLTRSFLQGLGFAVLLVLWGVLPSEARADDDVVQDQEPRPFDFKASVFTRPDFRDGYGRVGLRDSDTVRYRARFGLVSEPMDAGSIDVALKFIPQSTGVWNVGGDTLEDPALVLHEGSIAFSRPGYRLEIGRFEMIYGNHFVVGNVDWHEAGRSFDALRLHTFDERGAWLDYFVSVVDEGGGSELARGDTYFVGVYGAIGEWIDPGFELDLYAFGQLRPTGGDPARQRLARSTLGTRVEHRTGPVDYRLEAGIQLGVDAAQDILAYQGDLEVGWYPLGESVRIALEGFYATGDDPDSVDVNEGWDHLYPTAHKWLGFADIIGARTNVGGGVLHLRVKPVPKWTVNLDGHAFARPRTNAAEVSGFVGGEVDTGVRYAFATGAALRTNYSVFVPNQDAYNTPDPVHFAEFELRYDH